MTSASVSARESVRGVWIPLAPWLVVGLLMAFVVRATPTETLTRGLPKVAVEIRGMASVEEAPSVETIAAETLILPYEPGTLWVLTRGYNTDTHKNYGMEWYDDRYALDFAQESCGAWGQPVYATRPGVVVEAEYSWFGYGNVVVVDHGGGVRSRYAHLERIDVVVGDGVTRETPLGLSGNTGNVKGVACADHPGAHLHFVVYENGVGIKPEPLSGHVDFRVGCSYGHEGVVEC